MDALILVDFNAKLYAVGVINIVRLVVQLHVNKVMAVIVWNVRLVVLTLVLATIKKHIALDAKPTVLIIVMRVVLQVATHHVQMLVKNNSLVFYDKT